MNSWYINCMSFYISQNAEVVQTFRTPIPDISYLDLFGFNPESVSRKRVALSCTFFREH